MTLCHVVTTVALYGAHIKNARVIALVKFFALNQWRARISIAWFLELPIILLTAPVPAAVIRAVTLENAQFKNVELLRTMVSKFQVS